MNGTTLSKERYANLIKAERDLHDQIGQLDKLENCGVQCDVWRENIANALEQIKAIKQNFAPRNPLSQ